MTQQNDEKKTRFFTAEELEDFLIMKVVEEEDIEERRWSMSMRSILKVDDHFYRVHWDRGLTELQENYYVDQEAEEVFPHQEIVVEDKTVYLTEEEIAEREKAKKKSSAVQELQALEVAAGVEAVEEVRASLAGHDLQALVDLLEEQEAITHYLPNLRAHHVAAREYLQQLMKVQKALEKMKKTD